MSDYLGPLLALMLLAPDPPDTDLCALFPQPVSATGAVVFTFELKGLPDPKHVSVRVTGPTGFIRDATTATCDRDDTCAWVPIHPWTSGAYQWTTRAIDREAGCVGGESLPQTFTIP